MNTKVLDILINELQEKINYCAKDGAIVNIYEEKDKKNKQTILLDCLLIVNIYEKLSGGFELDIAWQPAEFDTDDNKHSISEPMYHHIAGFEMNEECFKFTEIDPDKKTKRTLTVEPVKGEFEKEFTLWQDFKTSNPELFENLEEKLKNIPWGKFIDHKGCE